MAFHSMAGCVCIGAGPSLNRVDVRRLGNYPTISFNRTFVAWSEWGFDPTYYACFDHVVIEDNHRAIVDAIEHSKVRRFFLNSAAEKFGLKPTERAVLLEVVTTGPFGIEGGRARDYGNVGASSLQILAWLGYRKVVLVGMDASYDRGATGRVEGNFLRVDEDRDHFHPDYQHGVRLLLCPDTAKILGQWPEAAAGAEKAGLDVVNASPGSRLDCFETMDFEEALKWLDA